MKFKPGDKVLVRGDATDYIDHLGGLIGTVVDVYQLDCEVAFEDHPTHLIWNDNMTLVEDDLK